MEKLPPIEKIYEAYGAIADNRISINNSDAFVKSSNLKKEYKVVWDEDIYSLNDNATYWQGYAGYPVIAVLMIKDKLPLNYEIANFFKNIDWNAINKKYRNKYDKAITEIMEELKKNGVDLVRIEKEVRTVYDRIKDINIIIKRSKLKPPK